MKVKLHKMSRPLLFPLQFLGEIGHESNKEGLKLLLAVFTFLLFSK